MKTCEVCGCMWNPKALRSEECPDCAADRRAGSEEFNLWDDDTDDRYDIGPNDDEAYWAPEA